MKQITKSDIKTAIADRWRSGLVVANVIVCIIAVIIIAVSIEPRETQVITRYSSFGITGFYRGYWYYLYSYVALVLIMTVGHSAISLKLMHMNRRDLALALLWSSLAFIVIAVLFALSITRIAALG